MRTGRIELVWLSGLPVCSRTVPTVVHNADVVSSAPDIGNLQERIRGRPRKKRSARRARALIAGDVAGRLCFTGPGSYYSCFFSTSSRENEEANPRGTGLPPL